MSTCDRASRNTATGPPPRGRVIELITSLWKAHVTAAIARPGVPGHLAGGPRTAAELAAAVPADVGAMTRLVQARAGLGPSGGGSAGPVRAHRAGGVSGDPGGHLRRRRRRGCWFRAAAGGG